MNIADKELLEEAKKALRLKNYKEIAVAIGDKESSVANWSNRGLSEIARLKISHLINSIKKEAEDNSGLTEREHKILEAYRSLPAEKKEMYFYKIVGDALEHEVMSNPIGGGNARTATSDVSQKIS